MLRGSKRPYCYKLYAKRLFRLKLKNMQMWTRLPSLKLLFGNFDSVFVTSIVDDVLALHFVLVMSPSQTVAYAYLGLSDRDFEKKRVQLGVHNNINSLYFNHPGKTYYKIIV